MNISAASITALIGQIGGWLMIPVKAIALAVLLFAWARDLKTSWPFVVPPSNIELAYLAGATWAVSR